MQLSINALEPLEYHLDLGSRLAQLSDAGILILASGNVVHNLGRIQQNMPDEGDAWAHRFDEHVAVLMQEAPGDLLKATSHPDYALAVPTPEHFVPLLYTAGISAASGNSAAMLIQGYCFGSLSMTCFGIGTPRAKVE